MKRLLTFEAFVPKNIDKRAEDLKKIQAKELQDYEDFIKKFSKDLSLIKNIKSEDPKEQLFIDLIQDCDIRLDQTEYTFRIFMFKDDQYMFEYDWKNSFLWCSYDRVWTIFFSKSKYNMSYQSLQQFISDQLEIHFKFRPFTNLIAAVIK